MSHAFALDESSRRAIYWGGLNFSIAISQSIVE